MDSASKEQNKASGPKQELVLCGRRLESLLVPLSPSHAANSPGAPLIQISQAHQSQRLPLDEEETGTENPAFSFDDVSDVESCAPRPLSSASCSSIMSTVAPLGARRNTLALTQQPQISLTVPAGSPLARRRHSLGSAISSPYELDASADPDDLGFLPGTQASMDYLMTPGILPPPKSPGAKSMQSNWSELLKLSRSDSIGSYHSEPDEEEYVTSSSNNASGMSSDMSERIIGLLKRFSSRTKRFKERTMQPPTPSTGEFDNKSAISAGSDLDHPEGGRKFRLDSFIPSSSRASQADVGFKEDPYIGFGRCRVKVPKLLLRLRFPDTIDPTSKFYLAWLFIVTIAFIYDAWSMTLRACFTDAPYYEPAEVVTFETVTTCWDPGENSTTLSPAETTETAFGTTPGECTNHTNKLVTYVTRYYEGYETDENRKYWWIFDYTADLVYLMDILLIKSRLRFVNDGMMEMDRKVILKNYRARTEFRLDAASLTPLDVFYLIPALNFNPMLRFPRVLKINTFWEFWDRMDRMVSSGHIIRVLRTMTYMMFLIHIEACGYYVASAYEGLGLNEWVYSGKGIAYIRCMYLATKTATSIGNNPTPENSLEYMFMTVYWLSGVFVFAMLIGQVRDIFQSAGMAQEQYRKAMDNTLAYMTSLNLPKDLQDRVRTWFHYNWENSKTLNENSLVEALPKKMKADLAIHVHYDTLSKVHLFQDCDKNLLFDLVLKLKPVLYLPMDYICKKGEVGTEMYIVNLGQVEVVGGLNNSVVFATLHAGSVFGEISLLALSGGNRRTADVRSKGFSQIFILSKQDFEEAMIEYPDADRILRKRAKKVLAQNAKKTETHKMEAEEIIQSRQGTPKLLKTVVKIVSTQSHVPEILGMRRGSNQKSGSNSSHSGKLSNARQEIDPVGEELDDEILVVEQYETSLSPENLNKVIDHNVQGRNSPETGCDLLPPLQQERASSSTTLSSGIASILDTPTKSRPNENLISAQKPSIRDESDSSRVRDKERKIAPVGSGNKNKVSPGITQTSKQTKENQNRRLTTTNRKSFAGTGIKNNKVGPAAAGGGGGGGGGVAKKPGQVESIPSEKRDESVKITIPSENLVTCSVEVHRAKTPTSSEPRDGVENTAFVDSDKSDLVFSTRHNSETQF